MLVNIIQNTISSFISAGFSVITSNLKMWLGFETSETLGREEVLNGDFSDGTTSWFEKGNSTISVGTYEGKTDVANINITDALSTSRIEQAFDYVDGQTYQVSVEVYLVSGSFKADSRDGFVDGDFVSTTTPNSWQTLTANFTAIQTGTDVVWLRSDEEFSQFYVNSISIKKLTQITPDKSGNNNVGELFTGKAIEFDGLTNYVTADGFAGTLSTDNAFTIVMWFKSDQDGQTQPYFNIQMSGAESDVNTNVFKFGASANSTTKGIHYQDTPGVDNNYKINNTVNYNDNVWHRLVISREQGTGYQDAYFYVDGVEIGDCPSQIRWDDLAKFSIGQEYDNGNVSDLFKGLISDVQIYNKNWLQADVTYDYANPQNLVTDRNALITLTSLKGYWAMSEGAGSVVYDNSGGSNNGTINGATYEPAQPRIPQLGMMNFSNGAVATGVTLIPNPNNTSQDIDGNAVRDRLNSFNLDGSGYAEVADDTDLDFGTGEFTLECWVKYDFLNQGSSFNVIVSNGNMSASGGSGFSLASKSSSFSIRLNAGSPQTVDFGSGLNQGQWYHIVVTRSGTTLKTYLDKSDTSNTILSVDVDTSLPVRIGGDTNSDRFYQNLISDVRLYKGKALTLNEVVNNYNAGLSAHTN